MPAVTRVGDNNTGHDDCPPIALASGSSDVFTNGIATGRVGDPYNPHGCPAHVTHVGNIASGAPHVFINGKACGRVGDPVTCGGSVAVGSPNVNVGNGGGPVGENEIQAEVVKTTLWNSAQDTTDNPDKTILSLPEISKNMANQSSTEIDSQGWGYLSQMFERWLANEAGELDTSEPAFIIDYDWLISYEGIRYFHDDLEQSALNEAAQNHFTEEIIKYYLGQTEFDCREAFNNNSPIYCNSRTVKDSLRYNYVTAEGPYVCLASFMLYALPKGKIQQLEDYKYRVTVEEIYLGAFDEFQFQNEQGYRYWSYKNKDFALTNFSYDINYKLLKNEHFRAFKRNYNKGKDFYVKSNLHKVEDFVPVTFEFEYDD